MQKELMLSLRIAGLVGVLGWSALAPAQAAVRIVGGGQVYDGRGISVRSHSTFPSLTKLADQTLLCYDMSSRDGGRTWSRHRPYIFPLADATKPRRGAMLTLQDGSVLLIGRATQRHEREPNVYVTEVYRSADNFVSYSGPNRGRIHVPHVAAGTDEYGQPASGPLFEHTIVELANGDLVAGMWGWFDEDRTPTDYVDRWKKWQLKKSRVMLVRSNDRGESWRYVTTVASDPERGPEGFRFPGLAMLPHGELLCLMRNGDGGKPLWLCRSSDEGKTWGDLEKIDVHAAYGSLLVLADGTLLLVYGKPGLWVIASADGGRTWDLNSRVPIGTGSTVAFIGRVEMVETEPGRVVCVYHDLLELKARVLRVTRE